MTRVNPEADVDLVHEATDLVQLIGEHLALKPKGREHIGLCPFHDDHTPSLTVVTHKGNGFYKCYACGAAGDAFSFVMNYHKMDFPQALAYLADRAGITLRRHAPTGGARRGPDRADLRQALTDAASFFRRTLEHPDAGRAARRMIDERRISAAMVEAFGLGAAPDQWEALHHLAGRRGRSVEPFVAAGLLKKRDSGQGCYDVFRNRLIFLIGDEMGRPVAFGARQLDPADEPKYLNTAESPLFRKSRTLYGLHLARRSIIESGRAIVTEGYTDVIACHQAGFTNVLGTLGTALTADHARVLKRLCETVVLLFDGDEAGQRAADRALEVLFAEPVDVKICILPDGLDPDDCLRGPDGPARFRAAVDGAVDALAYKVDRFRRELRGVTSLSGRQRRLEQFLADLGALGFGTLQGVRKRLIIAQLADLLGVSMRDVEQAAPRRRRSGAPKPAAAAPPTSPGPPNDESAAVSAARRRAEHDVLSILIYQPALRSQTVRGADGRPLSIVELLRPERFRDHAAQQIVRIIFPRLEADRDFTVQEILAEVGATDLRGLVSSLYLEGHAQAGAGGEAAAERLRAAAATLDRLIHRQRYQEEVLAFRRGGSESSGPVMTPHRLIEERRKQGYVPAAIGQGVRSPEGEGGFVQ